MYQNRILYAPLINYEKYKSSLLHRFEYKSEQVKNHLRDLKNQKITQALFLPKGANLSYDAIVFFDRMINLPISNKLVNQMTHNKIFTLSNFGFYLFLLKLSVHFTRIQEKIERNKGIDLGLSRNSI